MTVCFNLLITLGLILGYTESKLEERFHWKTIDFAYDNEDARKEAIENKLYIPQNVLPTDIAVSKENIFVSVPRRAGGVPTTLAYFSLKDKDKSPKLIPYPSFKENNLESCDTLISVNRGMKLDNCDRLWVIDSGKIGKDKYAKQLCPPRIHIFNIKTNKKLRMYTLKKTDYTKSSRFSAAAIDVGKTCDDFYYYITDQYGLTVYSWNDNDSWRFEHPFMGVDPVATNYQLLGLDFQWDESGIFGLALSPPHDNGFRTLYFHALSAFREFSVSTKILRNKKNVKNNYHHFKYVGSRGKLGRSTTEVMFKSDIIFFNLIDKNATACWNSKQPYDPEHIAIVAEDDEKLVFPTASVIDLDQRFWVMSNNQPKWLYDKLDCKSINFRILSATVKDLVAGTCCDL